VSEVKEKILPASTTSCEVAREFSTLDALRAEVRAQLETRRESRAARELRTDRGRRAPAPRVHRAEHGHAADRAPGRARARAAPTQGVDPDGVKWDVPSSWRAAPRRGAGRRRALLLEAIADKEGVIAATTRWRAEVKRSLARVSARRRPCAYDGEERRPRDAPMGLRERKTLDFLIGHATVAHDSA